MNICAPYARWASKRPTWRSPPPVSASCMNTLAHPSRPGATLRRPTCPDWAWALLVLRCQVASSQRRLQSCVGVFHEPVDSPGVLSVLLEDRVRVSDCVSHPRVVREQHGSSIGWIGSRWSFEGDEAIADLVAVHPRPEAQFVVSADAWFADFRERVLPSSEQLIMLSTNEVWPDVHVVDEAKLVATPDALGLRGVRVEAPVPLEAPENRQVRMISKVPERSIQPVSLTR